MEIEKEPKSLKETLAEISEQLTDLKKKKKIKLWSIPLKSRMLSRKKKQEGNVVFMNIGENKSVTFIKAPIQDGVALVNGIPHVVEPEDILFWKNKLPIVIQPQWSIKPFSSKDHFKEATSSGQGTVGWEYIMNYIYRTQIKIKKAMSIGLIIFLVVAVIGGGYYLLSSGVI